MNSGERALSSARLGFAHPGVLGEPLVLGPTDQTINACEKNRRGLEALAVGDDARGDVLSCFWASDHDGAHRPLPISCCAAGSIEGGCEHGLTQWRPDRGEGAGHHFYP